MTKPTVGRVVHYRENADADPLAAVVCAVLENGMTKPTVGRIVHYRETADADALAAVVCAVLEDGSLALSIFNANGHPSGAREVLHEDDAEPGGPRWSWPPKA